MRKIISFLLLVVAAVPAFSAVTFPPVPEPEVLSLLGIGAVAFLISRRNKK